MCKGLEVGVGGGWPPHVVRSVWSRHGERALARSLWGLAEAAWERVAWTEPVQEVREACFQPCESPAGRK